MGEILIPEIPQEIIDAINSDSLAVLLEPVYLRLRDYRFGLSFAITMLIHSDKRT